MQGAPLIHAAGVRHVCGLQMLERIAAGMRSAGGERAPEAAGLAPGARVALMVNSLGATTGMELSVAARAALARLAAMQASVDGVGSFLADALLAFCGPARCGGQQLALLLRPQDLSLTLLMRQVKVERVLVGAFMTALDMAGLSLSLLLLDDTRLARLDAPTLAPAWPAGIAAHVPGKAPLPLRRGLPEPPAAAAFSTTDDPADPELGKAVRHALAHAAASLMAAAPKLDELDSRCRPQTNEGGCYGQDNA